MNMRYWGKALVLCHSLPKFGQGCNGSRICTVMAESGKFYPLVLIQVNGKNVAAHCLSYA